MFKGWPLAVPDRRLFRISVPRPHKCPTIIGVERRRSGVRYAHIMKSLFAVEQYKKGEASLGRAAELAGIPLGQMMTVLTEFGVESRIEQEDYLQGLAALRKAW